MPRPFAEGPLHLPGKGRILSARCVGDGTQTAGPIGAKEVALWQLD